ncbi:Eco29kI family restriction endonuclease [Nocardia farcinica]|uniref:Eco29kI family restriction endonuclease n=1 Tax=Nocardia farcinica TaxID=37329 RepID=UPI0024542BD1|nr:Eco29kI family restriction endonuclease [Nocardia farcinica]
MTTPFNPLDMENLAQSIVTRMEQTDPTPLGDVKTFTGAGVYAIYYKGPFKAYGMLSARNQESCTIPIYVGKGVPEGGRRGLEVVGHAFTKKLSERIRKHARSIEQVENLDIEDFAVRWLVVEDIWIALGESAMIRRYKPLWNAMLDGFGNNAPGVNRDNSVRSAWDTLHPGRSHARELKPREDGPEALEQEVRQYLKSRLS